MVDLLPDRGDDPGGGDVTPILHSEGGGDPAESSGGVHPSMAVSVSEGDRDATRSAEGMPEAGSRSNPRQDSESERRRENSPSSSHSQGRADQSLESERERDSSAGSSHSQGRADESLGEGELEASAGSSGRPQRDAAQCLVDSLHLGLLPAPVLAMQSRDAMVQTSPGSTLHPAHLLPHVDSASQTSPALSSTEDLSENVPSATMSTDSSVRLSTQSVDSSAPLHSQSTDQSTLLPSQSTNQSTPLPSQSTNQSTPLPSQSTDLSTPLPTKASETLGTMSENVCQRDPGNAGNVSNGSEVKSRSPACDMSSRRTDQRSEERAAHVEAWEEEGVRSGGGSSQSKKRSSKKSGTSEDDKQTRGKMPPSEGPPASLDHSGDDSRSQQLFSELAEDALSIQRAEVHREEDWEPLERTLNQGPSERTSNLGPSERTSNQGSSERTSNQGPSERTSNQGPSERTSNQGPSDRTSNQDSSEMTSKQLPSELRPQADSGQTKSREERSPLRRSMSVVNTKHPGQENFSFLPDEAREMQVMVNSLTPVLQRRKTARRSNSHSGAVISSICSEDLASSGTAEDLQQLLASFTSDEPLQNPSLDRRERHPPQADVSGRKEEGPSTLVPSRRSPDRARVEDVSGGDPGISGSGNGGLFIKPKFARTWHGPVQTGRAFAAPKMGVTMMTASDYCTGTNNANTRGTAGCAGYSGSGGLSHVHTMPVISRTLLDAMHKRYCSYQYSGWAPSFPYSLPPGPGGPRRLPPPLPAPPPPPAAPRHTTKKLSSEGESEDTGSGSVGGATSEESSPRAALHPRPHTSQQAPEPGMALRDDLATASTTGPTCNIPAPPAATAAATAADVDADADGDGSSSASSSLQKHSTQRKEKEIEAEEACQWLRAAGFPQYAQMFEVGVFPVDISDVQRDHDFLDNDSIQSVIRRLNILNTCSVMKIDAQSCKKAPEDSDEEDQCALSRNWEYQKGVHRWSRKLEPKLSVREDLNQDPSTSHDSLLGEDSGSHTDDSPLLDSKMPHATAPLPAQHAPHSVRIQVEADSQEPPIEGGVTVSQQDSHVSSFPISPKLRRAASERLKSALKKMESFKKSSSKKYPLAGRHIVEISDPVVSDQEGMQAKLDRLNCVDIAVGGGRATTPTPRLPPPPQESTPLTERLCPSAGGGEDVLLLSPLPPIPPSYRSAGDASSVHSSTVSGQGDASSLSEYYSAHSQLLASLQEAGSRRKNSDCSLREIFLLPQDHKPGSFPRLLKNGYIDTTALQYAPPPPPSSLAGVGLAGGVPLSSRVSMYDNLGPSSPQRVVSSSSSQQRGLHRDGLDTPLSRHSQVVRSLSSGPSHQEVALMATAMDLGLSGFASMVRSRSASATTSLEHQALSGRWRGSEGVGEGRAGGGQASTGMEELDALLQNLYRDIHSLTSPFGSVEEEEDSRDTAALDTLALDAPLTAVLSNSSSASTITGGVGHREVSFSITDHNGSGSFSSITHSHAGSVLEDSGAVSQQSTATEALTTAPSAGEVDDSMEGEEVSSQGSSEEIEGSADETLERIIMEAHERRDSGVGSSLTRASRERTRKKIRWESFQKCHRPSRASRDLQIGGLSVCQLLPLRQLSLLRLTSIMEKCSPTSRSQWSWSVPRFMKRHKAPQFTGKNVFGVPFTVMVQRTGQPLPQCVLCAMRYLRKTCHDAIGIFRKSGVRSRIQKLRDMVEACPDTVNFDELQPYDVADLLKQYFRELPECLLTSKLSDTFRSIFSHVPGAQRLEALQTAVVLLPEENREVLHCLLLFLGDIAEQADKHQMNASNLAVCFAPSLFNFLGSHGTNSPKRQRRGLGVPEQRELLEQKAVHECFTYMISHCKKLFMVPPSMYSRLHLSTLSNMEPVHLDEFYAKGKTPGPDYKAFGEEHIQMLLKEAHDKNRGWAPVSVSVSGIEVLQRKLQDGHPLRQWKCSVEIEAPPIEVLDRILHERHKWDDDMLSWRVMERLNPHCDVFHYALNSMAPHPPRHFIVIRYWRPDLVKGACAVVSRSVEHCGARGGDMDQGVRAVELGSCHLMEPCGSGRSRVTFIARTDLRGRCPEWYNRVFGHMSANYLDRLRDSFRQDADGPETKV